MDSKALHKISYGLFVLTANSGGSDGGCIINTAIQAASSPNSLSICVNKQNHTHDMVMESGKFAISVISREADFELFKRFGFQSGRDVDKFAGFSGMERGTDGLYHITGGTNARFSATVEKTLDLGSHTLFVGPVTDMAVLSATPSATYEYYHAHIKPRPQDRPASKKTVWRCIICGYEYEGDVLPPDFICPICKHPASDFEKVEK